MRVGYGHCGVLCTRYALEIMRSSTTVTAECLKETDKTIESTLLIAHIQIDSMSYFNMAEYAI
jgi:hypothetical protein